MSKLEGYENGREVSEGAEKYLGSPIEILDHGFLYLVDYMGTDQSIEQAARVSYGKGTRSVSKTRGLIRYLMRHRHTSPFEMVELKFHAKMPIFVARQWVRHRTASLNEYSGRYSEMPKEFYIPSDDVIQAQSETNNQGRGSELSKTDKDLVAGMIQVNAEEAFHVYDILLNRNVARELSRTVLPVGGYTEWYWKIDLHNLFHFLGLRMDEHAQWEIRQYANVIGDIVSEGWPLSWEAFKDYRLNAVQLSAQEFQILQNTLIHLPDDILSAFLEDIEESELSNREKDELKAKLL